MAQLAISLPTFDSRAMLNSTDDSCDINRKRKIGKCSTKDWKKQLDSTKMNNSQKENGKKNVKVEVKVEGREQESLVGDIHHLVTMLD